MKKLILIPLVVAAAGCGSQTGSTSTVTSPPETVTKTVTIPAAPVVQTVTKYKTKTVTKKVTPESCRTALFGMRSAALTLSKAYMETIKGVQHSDVSAIQDANTKVNKATAKVKSIQVAYVDCITS
jgi:hypothetical protein